MESETELTQNAALKTLYQKTQVSLDLAVQFLSYFSNFRDTKSDKVPPTTVIFFRLRLCWIFYRNCPNLKRIRSIL